MRNKLAADARLWSQARRYLAHGVNSPVRSFRAVERGPLFAAQGRGAFIQAADGRRYLDYIGGWGPLILGHAHPSVCRAIAQQLRRGTTFGIPTELETALARQICAAFPSMERIRFTCSGTEACMSAVRLARAATQRDAILKFAGCYHGHADSFLVQAGSGLATFGTRHTARGTQHTRASSAGVPAGVAAETLVAEYNDLAAARSIFARHRARIAAVIVEPWAANMGLVLPQPGFLEGLRELTRAHGSLLIFDEVITGFRATYGGVQHLERVQPDLTILGKIIGGGLPAAAFGGRKALMDLLAPEGPVYQAGTLAGHPLAMAAGLATLEELRRERPYASLAARTRQLAEGLREVARACRAKVRVAAAASLLTCFFTDGPVMNFTDAQRAATRRYARFFRGMQAAGALLPPSQFEAWFLSAAHTERDIARTLRAARRVLRTLTTAG